MLGFIGRERELAFLESIWNEERNRSVSVTGRRQIGKSTLLKRFCEDHRAVYIMCVQGSLADNLWNISRTLEDLDGRRRDVYTHIRDALEDILGLCRQERTVVVFDELPYILGTGEHVASSIQHFVDELMRETESMIVVCGSSLSMMRKETTDHDRPLYGRFRFQLSVGPLPYEDCARMHPDMPDRDRLMLYLTVGGVPKYHLDGATCDYRGYVIRHFLEDGADLSGESENTVSAELAPRGRYLAIVNAISGGKTSLKTIAESTSMDNATCKRHLEALIGIGVVGTVHPMMGSPKRPVYTIDDDIVAFCQDIVRKSESLSMRDPGEVYDLLEQDIRSFLGHRFERFCADYVRRHWSCIEIGRWWGPDGDGEIREVDIVATVIEGSTAASLFGECKFTSRPVSMRVLEDLRSAANLTRDGRTRRYVLFSVSGFTEDLEELAEHGGVTLVGPGELFAGPGHRTGRPAGTWIWFMRMPYSETGD